MKRLLAPLFLVAVLTGCVALPYDTYATYPATPVVSGYYSSGYASGYYSPAPVYVPPAVQFNYSRSYSPRIQAPAHRHEGRRPDGGRHGGDRHDAHRREGGRHDGGRGTRGTEDAREHFRSR